MDRALKQSVAHKLWVGAAVATALVLAACGEKRPTGGSGGGKESAVADAFKKASSQNDIPRRFLMAVGYLESRLSPQKASAFYANLGKEGRQPLGTVMTQTAFGVTYEQLGLDPKKKESRKLETQIEAYSKWLDGKLQGMNLAKKPRSPEETYYWIENLAKLHRKGLSGRRNVQAVFAHELVRILNEGFIWQDVDSTETLELDKSKPPIDPSEFPVNGRKFFDFRKVESEIGNLATFLPLATNPSDEFENKPARVEIIHCPLTMSACLELQTRTQESDVRMAAHYIIPRDQSIFSRVVQVAEHSRSLILTNKRGEHEPVNDAIILMLAGNSGRIVKGKRKPAIPTWFTDTQLTAMAEVVNDVCTRLESDHPNRVDRQTCMGLSGDKGVRFRTQGGSEEYRWGDIADFDPMIFEAYIKNRGRLDSEVAFEIKKGDRTFSSGSTIPLTVLFSPQAERIELQHLSRCHDGSVIWEPVDNDPVRGQTRHTFREKYYDSGPNRSGHHFFRVRVYDRDHTLLGWAIDQVHLTDYETEPVWASEGWCRRQ